jgi:uncharacterized protein YkwD
MRRCRSVPSTAGWRSVRVIFLLPGLVILSSLITTASGQAPSARLVSAYHPTALEASSASLPVNSAAPATPPSTGEMGAPEPVSAPGLERQVFDLINAERRAHGEATLVWDAELSRMARLHSESMARLGFFDHTDPQGRGTVERAHDCGIYGWRALGENISYNQGFDDPGVFAVERWIRSPRHRDNILNAGFTHSGLGVAKAADGRIFFTQVFLAR